MPNYQLVLVIDDDHTSNFICDRTLRNQGIAATVVCVNTLHEGIDYLKTAVDSNQNVPDLILLDLRFPEESGWDFFEKYQTLYEKMQKKANLFVLTSSISKIDIEKARTQTLIKGFINKPMTELKVKQLI